MHPPEIPLKPIGWLRADFQQKFGTPRQGSLARSSQARIELAPEWRGRGILSGLEGFSHVWLITHLHLSTSTRQRGKIHPPRLGGAKVGVLASRSPHRPNNIGLTLARVRGCEGDVLSLSEIDLVDGTPILDMKPYLAAADRPEDFKGGWTDQLEIIEKRCVFTEAANHQLTTLAGGQAPRLKKLIQEMLTLDPRPPAYLQRQNPKFAIYVANLNVIFTYEDNTFTIQKVERKIT